MKYTYLSFFLLAAACKQAPKAGFAGFEQMEGSWVCRQPNGQVFYENWKITGDRMYGRGYLLQGNDTLFSEKLVVEQVYGRLIYMAHVPGQDPVMFTRQAAGPNSFRFENKEHDFPQVVLYEQQDNNTVRVFLSGTEKDSTISEEMIYKHQQP